MPDYGDQGGFQGSGSGEAATGGNRPGNRPNQGGNTPFDSGYTPYSPPTQPAPNIPTQNEIADTPLNAEITAAGAQIMTESGPLTDGQGNMIAAGQALQDYRNQVAANQAVLNELGIAGLGLPGYDPTANIQQQLDFSQQLTDLYNQEVGNIQTDNLNLLSQINPNFSAGTGITAADVQGLTDLTGQSALTQQIAENINLNVAAQEAKKERDLTALGATQTKPSPFRNFMDFVQSTQDYFSETGPLDIAKDAAVGTLNTFSNPGITGSLGLGLTGVILS